MNDVGPANTATRRALFKSSSANVDHRNSMEHDSATGAQRLSKTPSAGLTLLGVVTRILYKNEETGEHVIVVKTTQGDLVVKGVASSKLVAAVRESPGNTEVHGSPIVAENCQIEVDSVRGESYRATVIHEKQPNNEAGMAAYLERTLEGVGKSLAQRIVAKFGPGTYDILDYEPRRLLEINGVGQQRLDVIIGSRQEETELRAIWTMLLPLSIGGAIPRKILNAFGNKSISVMNNDPYMLTTLPGVSFETADKIALSRGILLDSKERIQGAMAFIITEKMANDGHTAIPAEKLVRDIRKITALTSDVPVLQAIAEAIEKRSMIERIIAGTSILSSKRQALIEKGISSDLVRLITGIAPNSILADSAAEAARNLGDVEQIAAIKNVFLHGVTVITGWPGCGKTTVIKYIAQAAINAGLSITTGCPTNKAARRITESTKLPSGTIHGLLGMHVGSEVPAGRTAEYWKHHSKNPLKGDLFIADEFSMMDASISRAFLDAIPTGARLVIVGDYDQLASVGPGNVLHDIIHSKMVPVTRLVTPHRAAKSSDIVINSHKIIKGDVSGVDLRGSQDFLFTPAITEGDVLRGVMDAYRELMESYGTKDVQILVSRHGTAVGVDALNKMARQIANPASPDKPTISLDGVTWREGDRVICVRALKGADGGAKVTNGEVGMITGIDLEDKRVFIDYEDRTTAIHNRRDMKNIKLAYAITTHKSQGSEFKGVVLVMPEQHAFMFNRNLFYTGLTRGKSKVVLVGSEKAVRTAIAKPGAERATGLNYEIKGAFARAGLDQTPPPALLKQRCIGRA